MERAIDHDLQEISGYISQMAKRVEFMLESSMKALREKDMSLAQDVISIDREIDSLELLVDESVHRMIALRQPAAGDLRIALAAIKINTDLERMGDYCEAICRQVSKLTTLGSTVPELDETPKLSAIVSRMLKGAIQSYTTNSYELAKQVILSDDEADALYREVTTSIHNRMKKDPASIDECASILLINSRLERIADQATNICEEVIFVVTGDNIKHKKRTLIFGAK